MNEEKKRDELEELEREANYKTLMEEDPETFIEESLEHMDFTNCIDISDVREIIAKQCDEYGYNIDILLTAIKEM